MLGNMFEVDGVTYVPTSISERTCDVVDYDCTYRVMAYLRSGCKNEKARAFYEFLKNKAQV